MDSPNAKHIYQSKKESLPRSQYFVAKRAQENNDDGINDQYLKYLRARSIQIRDVDYYSPD